MNREEINNKIKEKEIAINNIKNELNKLKAMLILKVEMMYIHIYL